jgi:serine/threonine protein kinase
MPIVSRCPDRQQLQAYLQKALPRSESQAVKSHLGRCDACQTVVASLKEGLPPTERNRRPRAEPGDPPSGERRHVSDTPRLSSQFPFLLAAASPEEVGRLGNYRVLRLLGEGGMGFVFLAEDIALGRPVALKVMKPELAGAEGWQRFLREARTMAAIKHDHLVTIFQAGQEGDAAYFAMEYLEGETLDQRLGCGPLPEVSETLRLGREIASGLAFLHDRGLIHRDIKPANLWLEAPRGHVKILDLGLTRRARENVNLTQSGLIVGTPGFLSPEQARGEPLDPRSDLFSLGCVLYCLCTGNRPFPGTTALAVLTALATDDPPPAHTVNPRVPLPLSDLVRRLLAIRADERPASADAVREELERIEQELKAPSPPPKKSSGTWAIATGHHQKPEAERPRAPGRGRLKVGLAILLLFGAAFAARSLVGELHVAGSPTPSAEGVVFLSDLPKLRREYHFVPPPHPDGEQPGEVVRVKGKVFPHAIFMHPPPLPPGAAASISYRLGKQYRTFRTTVSMNDGPPRSSAACTFAVYGDGRLLWQSAPVWSHADAQPCAVSVRGVDVLKIAVTSDGPPFGAHMVWLEPSVKQ